MTKRDVISKAGKTLGEAATIEHPIVQKKIDKSLKMSVKEGSLASVSGGFGLSYFAPFALVMISTNTRVLAADIYLLLDASSKIFMLSMIHTGCSSLWPGNS